MQTVDHSVVVVASETILKDLSSILVNSQFSIPVLRNLCSQFVILVEDSDTGGPSSITVRMEYLSAFQF